MSKREPADGGVKPGKTGSRDAERPSVRIWRADAQEPALRRVEGSLVLDRELLGKYATSAPEEAPLLTLSGASVQVDVRKRRRFVWAIPGRRFDDFPGNPGTLGRYWTWVVHPEKDESLVLLRRQPPQHASYMEGQVRLYRLRTRPIRGDIDSPLRMKAPCIVVAGLGAVEISSALGSTRLGQPALLARLDLDELRRRLQSIPLRETKLSAPCVVPNNRFWKTSEQDAAAALAGMLDGAFGGMDAPDWLLLPCYLADSAPGIVLARRGGDGWVFTSSGSALESWIQGGCEPVGTPPAPASPSSAATRPAPFEHGQYRVLFENEGILKAARELVLEGKDYRPGVARAATQGAWRRAACVYALRLRECATRDLRQCGWSSGMARCVEELVNELGTDTREWLRKEDGPRAFAEKFTVRRGDAAAEDATEALAALIDAAVRPHGRTKTGTGPTRARSSELPAPDDEGSGSSARLSRNRP
ncbi:hypothetical protein [Sorangium sp. So ce1151]|uniref:hypothetical protein n=1 Tax=Sorangium sp. So ce1151 TaxID=3133332 RepID=UPI003F5D5FED